MKCDTNLVFEISRPIHFFFPSQLTNEIKSMITVVCTGKFFMDACDVHITVYKVVSVVNYDETNIHLANPALLVCLMNYSQRSPIAFDTAVLHAVCRHWPAKQNGKRIAERILVEKWQKPCVFSLFFILHAEMLTPRVCVSARRRKHLSAT